MKNQKISLQEDLADEISGLDDQINKKRLEISALMKTKADKQKQQADQADKALEEMSFTNDIGKDDYMDDEGRMAKSQMYKMGRYVMKLTKMLDDMEQLPAWVQSKITKASDYMSAVYHYLEYEFLRKGDNLMEHLDT